ncbi:PREDICTED: uncharacterized protein LOC107071561 isoform X2 [Polistes dominula]|uniref:Uncharacterized protein LOC107071561 isoform X2 n=1 Tax=Polistes dominula TaxID=743375 RepID=A0ABM1J105_POLDO|nr:PREDICTED: uncharacterized protein LOC107071561 isoform X2 [Polistes dominula]
MAKTPISILQEFGMKQGYLPEYTLLSERIVNHLSVFNYQVKYKDLLALDIVSMEENICQTKQIIPLKENLPQTKQIIPLEENISKTKQILQYEEISSKLDSWKVNSKPEDTTNYIGKLQEYCLINNLIHPEYVVNDVSGKPHLQKFTMACKLGAIVEEATSTTKKQAKQLAAKQLLNRLGNSNALILVDRCDKKAKDKSVNENNDDNDDDDILTKSGIRLLKLNSYVPDNDIKEKYRELTNKNCINDKNVDKTQAIKNYHYYIKEIIRSNISGDNKDEQIDKVYHNIKRFKESLSNVINDNNIEQLPFDNILKYIKEVLKLNIEKKTMTCKDPLLKAIAYKITAPIPVIQFGINKNLEVAEAHALHNILDTIMIYLR